MDKYVEYQQIIKPIEKKYNRLLLLYSYFKFPFFKRKLDYYNKILINYYKYLLENEDIPKEMFK